MFYKQSVCYADLDAANLRGSEGSPKMVAPKAVRNGTVRNGGEELCDHRKEPAASTGAIEWGTARPLSPHSHSREIPYRPNSSPAPSAVTHRP